MPPGQRAGDLYVGDGPVRIQRNAHKENEKTTGGARTHSEQPKAVVTGLTERISSHCRSPGLPRAIMLRQWAH